jgi:hypothetical protein
MVMEGLLQRILLGLVIFGILIAVAAALGLLS